MLIYHSWRVDKKKKKSITPWELPWNDDDDDDDVGGSVIGDSILLYVCSIRTQRNIIYCAFSQVQTRMSYQIITLYVFSLLSFVVYLWLLMLCLYMIIVFFRTIHHRYYHHRDHFSPFSSSFFFLSLFFVWSIEFRLHFFFFCSQTNHTHTYIHIDIWKGTY